MTNMHECILKSNALIGWLSGCIAIACKLLPGKQVIPPLCSGGTWISRHLNLTTGKIPAVNLNQCLGQVKYMKMKLLVMLLMYRLSFLKVNQ